MFFLLVLNISLKPTFVILQPVSIYMQISLQIPTVSSGFTLSIIDLLKEFLQTVEDDNDHKHIIINTTYRRFLMPLQETTFENLEAKEEIAHNFSFCHKCFQLYSVIVLSFIESFLLFNLMFLKSSASDCYETLSQIEQICRRRL